MKNTLRNLLVILIVGLAACSCTSTYYATLVQEKTYNPDGKTYQELVRKYGAPNRTVDDGEGGYIAVFTGSKVFQYNSSKFGSAVPELQCYMDGETDICYRHEVVNAESRGVFSPGKTLLMLLLL